MSLWYNVREGGDIVAYSEASKNATLKYLAANLEEVRFRVRKGERDVLKTEAAACGLSLTQYVVQAINEKAGRQILTPSNQD